MTGSVLPAMFFFEIGSRIPYLDFPKVMLGNLVKNVKSCGRVALGNQIAMEIP